MKHAFAVIIPCCSRHVNSTVRLSNLLLTMRQRVDVKANRFQYSLGPVAEVMGSKLGWLGDR
jgi:hypothetical protein